MGEFSISDLMPEALRQNLSRLIVGEVRGGEAAAIYKAMHAGTEVGQSDPRAVPVVVTGVT